MEGNGPASRRTIAPRSSSTWRPTRGRGGAGDRPQSCGRALTHRRAWQPRCLQCNMHG
jgi:hypothetical protein